MLFQPIVQSRNPFNTSYSLKSRLLSNTHNAPSKMDNNIARRRFDLRRHIEPQVPGQHIRLRLQSASVTQLRLERTWSKHNSFETGNTAGHDSETERRRQFPLICIG